MSKKLYMAISGSIFLLIGMFHLLRLVCHLTVTVGAWTVPLWLSYVGFPVATGYGIWAYLLFRK